MRGITLEMAKGPVEGWNRALCLMFLRQIGFVAHGIKDINELRHTVKLAKARIERDKARSE